MDSKTFYRIEFTFEEAVALKKALGCQSDSKREEKGIDLQGREFLHELFNVLPDDEEY